jgi:hypothetical protein
VAPAGARVGDHIELTDSDRAELATYISDKNDEPSAATQADIAPTANGSNADSIPITAWKTVTAAITTFAAPDR